MLDFSIQLKSGTTKDALAIIVAYSKEFHKHRFVYSTGIKVPRSSFNAAKPGKQLKGLLEKAEQAYKSLKDEGHPVNNESLKARMNLFVKGVQWAGDELHVLSGSNVQRYHTNEGIDKLQLEKIVKNEFQKARPNIKKVVDSVLSDGTNELFGFFQAVIDGTIKPRSGKPLRKLTIKAKKQTLALLKEYNPQATFETVNNMRFYNEFTGWMAKQTVKKETEKGKFETVKRFDANSIGKHIKDLKSILNLAHKNEILETDKFRHWSVVKESNEVIALSKDEILKINSLELTGTKDDVRDLFILACFLGARISDFNQFKKDSLQTTAGITYFQYTQQKTGSRVSIPVHPIALAILEKRNGEFPKMISEQNFRYILKDICQAAELNDRVLVKVRDGKPEYKKKFEAISPHSARRTFASSLFYGWFNRPMPASLVMRFTGHRTEKSFLLYIGASEHDLNKKALEYFDFPQMKVS